MNNNKGDLHQHIMDFFLDSVSPNTWDSGLNTVRIRDARTLHEWDEREERPRMTI